MATTHRGWIVTHEDGRWFAYLDPELTQLKAKGKSLPPVRQSTMLKTAIAAIVGRKPTAWASTGRTDSSINPPAITWEIAAVLGD
jgi:hypothetical protein